MKQSKFSPQQIVKILKEFSDGTSMSDLCRKYNVSQGTIYNWRKKYGGLEAEELKRLKSLKKDLLHNVTVIIRSSGEATLSILRSQVLEEVHEENVFIIEEEPFSKAVEKTFTLGIENDKKWTLALDADLILTKNSILKLLQSAENYDEKLYVYQGYILDKFRCSVRQGGPHLYLTLNLLKAKNILSKANSNLRPESNLYREMAKKQYQIIVERKVFALHDFFQKNEDIYRKGYFHGIKHRGWKTFLPLWLEKSETEVDYKFAALGFIEGYINDEKDYPDINKLKIEGAKATNTLNAKTQDSLKVVLNDDVINEILKGFGVLLDLELNILKEKKSFYKKVKDKLKFF